MTDIKAGRILDHSASRDSTKSHVPFLQGKLLHLARRDQLSGVEFMSICGQAPPEAGCQTPGASQPQQHHGCSNVSKMESAGPISLDVFSLAKTPLH